MKADSLDESLYRSRTPALGSATARQLRSPVRSLQPPDLVGTLHHFARMPSRFIKPRTVEIWLPPAYGQGNSKGYAVLYMHDGQNLFEPQKSFIGVDWGVDEALATLGGQKQIRPVIVVGIWNTPQRLREYLPQRPFSAHQSQGLRRRLRKHYGGTPLSDQYLHFLVHELKPFVDSRYRTRPQREHTYLMGSSMGGLISLYAMCEYPQIFGGAGCLSTHWPIAPQALWAYLKKRLPKAGRHKIYLDYGDEAQSSAYRASQRQADLIMQGRGYRFGRDWLSYWYDRAPHSETAWRTRLKVPLRFLLHNTPRPWLLSAAPRRSTRVS